MLRLVSGEKIRFGAMRSRNFLFPAWVINVSALATCTLILLYMASHTKVIENNKDKERNEDNHVVDVKYIEFFSVR